MKKVLYQLIGVLFVSVGLFGMYCVWYTTVTAKSDTVVALEEKINTATKTGNRIAAARTALTEIANEEQLIRTYFVPETGVVAFINSLEAQAREQNVTLNVSSLSKGGSATRPVLTFSIELEGTFDAVVRSIGAIEYGPYDLTVSALSFNSGEKGMWNATLGLVVGSVSIASTTTP